MSYLRSLAAGAVIAGFSWAAQAATWDMPTPYGETNFHTVNIKKFADDVKAATGGKLEIKVHSGGSLIKHPEIKNAFLASNYDQARKLWQASKSKTEELLKQQGLQVLYAVPWPPQGLYAKKDVGSLADLKGLKFRAYNAATERVAQLAGAVPTQIEVPDIPQAFATGRVEAMITSPSTGANTKAWDYVSNFYHLQAWMPKNIIVVNAKAFAKLDKDTRDAVLAAAKTAEDRGWTASMAETDSKIAMLKENGMKVSPPSSALTGELQEIGKTMTDEWAKQAGADGAAILDAYRK